MKKGLAVILFVFTVLLCSCSGRLTPSPYTESELDSNGAVSLYTQDNLYVPDANSMLLYIRSNAEEELTYGEGLRLEVYKNNEWFNIPYRGDYITSLLAYTLKQKETDYEDIYIKGYDYNFKDGQYRVVKQIGDKKYTAGFTIAEDRVSSNTPFGFVPLEELPQDYTKEEAISDGVVFVEEESTTNSEKVLRFIQNVSVGAEDMLRTALFTIEGDIILYDITYVNNICGQYYIVRCDVTRDKWNADIIYHYALSYLYADKKSFSFSNHPDWNGDYNICFSVPIGECDSFPTIVSIIGQMNGHCINAGNTDYISRSRDGMKSITMDGGKLSYNLRTCEKNRIKSRQGTVADKLNIAMSIRDVVWMDEITILFVCDTDSELTYYEFYDTDKRKVMDYTSSLTELGYSVESEGVVIYAENFKDSFVYPPIPEK